MIIVLNNKEIIYFQIIDYFFITIWALVQLIRKLLEIVNINYISTSDNSIGLETFWEKALLVQLD